MENKKMSKYQKLWQYIKENDKDIYILSYDQIEKIINLPLNHSFLTTKKELLAYGYKVEKISMKEKTVTIKKI